MDPKQVLPDQLQSGTNMHSAVFQNKMSGGSGEGITTGFAVSDIRPGLAGYTVTKGGNKSRRRQNKSKGRQNKSKGRQNKSRGRHNKSRGHK
jgi:hypothetical protein